MSRQSHPLSFNHPKDLINSMEQVLLEKLTSSQLMKKFPHFMEPECSLQYSQQPTTYPILSWINLVHPTLSIPEDPF